MMKKPSASRHRSGKRSSGSGEPVSDDDLHETSFDSAVAFAREYCEKLLHGWDGRGPSPEPPDPIDEDAATDLKDMISLLQRMIADHPESERAVVLAYELGQRVGLLGSEKRLAMGHRQRRQLRDASAKGVDARRAQGITDAGDLEQDVLRLRAKFPDITNYALAVRLADKYGYGGQTGKTISALAKKISRLRNRS